MQVQFSSRFHIVATHEEALQNKLGRFAKAARRLNLPMAYMDIQKVTVTETGALYRTTVLTGETLQLENRLTAVSRLDRAFYKSLQKDTNIVGLATNDGVGPKGLAGLIFEMIPFTFYHKGQRPSLLYRLTSPVRRFTGLFKPQKQSGILHIA